MMQRKSLARAKAAVACLTNKETSTADADVIAEQEKIAARCEAYISREGAVTASQEGTPYAVQMFGLRKTYKRAGLFSKKPPFVAVESNWLGICEGLFHYAGWKSLLLPKSLGIHRLLFSHRMPLYLGRSPNDTDCRGVFLFARS